MPTLVYAPGVRILIETAKAGIVEVTDDISDGRVTRTSGAPSTAAFSLINHRRKYDQLFTPNDRIVIYLKRLRWLVVFTGYVNSVPYFSTFPATVALTATCSLKQLQMLRWDPGARASVDLLFGIDGGNDTDVNRAEVDGGLKRKAMLMLTEVARWPEARIHIGQLPTSWVQKAKRFDEFVDDYLGDNTHLLGPGPTVGGTSAANQGRASIPSDIPYTGTLPAYSGRISWFGGPNGGAYGAMNLTGESGVTPRDPWYVAMRWPYYQTHPTGGHNVRHLSREDERAAMNWWRNRKILVVNPANQKSVVVRAADWGPRGDLGRAVDVSKQALEALGAKTDDNVQIAFAPDSASLGPIQRFGPVTPDRVAQGIAQQDPLVATGAAVIGAGGLRFTHGDSLQPNTFAAREFIRSAWDVPRGIGGYAKRNVEGTNTLSDHARGLALDVMVSEEEPDDAQIALGNAVVQWFISNPGAFDLKYVIWQDMINSGNGWKPYGPSKRAGGRHPSPRLGHRNHPHFSFNATSRRSLGPMGNPWPGADMAGFSGGIGALPGSPGSIGVGLGEGPWANLINAFHWYGQQTYNPSSDVLYGPRALMNNTQFLPSLKAMVNASMRDYCSAPNGDFIAWFPDYFGVYGTAARMTVRDIELEDFTVGWSDDRLVTHQFVIGAMHGYSQGAQPGGPFSSFAKATTRGVASVEMAEVMEALFNLDMGRDRSAWGSAKHILQRFGARPDFQQISTISAGGPAEFWYALWLFQRNWAQQFSANVPISFMPELYPGMLLHLPDHHFQAYVEEVTHTFSLRDGGGFSTQVRIIAPSSTDGRGLPGLVKGSDPTEGGPAPREPVRQSEPPRVPGIEGRSVPW